MIILKNFKEIIRTIYNLTYQSIYIIQKYIKFLLLNSLNIQKSSKQKVAMYPHFLHVCFYIFTTHIKYPLKYIVLFFNLENL